MSELKKLKRFFRDGSAEKEREIRNIVFVETESVQKLLNRFDENFIIIKSPKGTGKSYILEELASKSFENDAISISIKPKDLNVDKISKCSSIGAKEKEAEEQIINIISDTFGKIYAMDEIPFNDSERNLYMNAVANGTVRRDLLDRAISCVIDFIPRGDKIKNALKSLSPLNTSSTILREDISNVLKSKPRKVILFLDDIDLAGTKTDISIDYESSWAIIAAAFNISCEFAEISMVISVRTDVWHTMLRKRLGVDKRDKITDLFLINNTAADMIDIFYRRLYAALDFPERMSRKEILGHFFDGDMILPGVQNEARPWDSWICKQSRERPRDLVQLMKLIINQALDTKSSKINSTHAGAVLENFANSRVSNIADEFLTICPRIDALCKRFRKTLFEFNEIIQELKLVPASLSISIDGKQLHQNDFDDALEMLRILHMANFMNPRVKDSRMQRGYAHLLYIDNEDLISKNNLEQLSKYQYEIHPVFHSLIAAQKKW